MSGLKIIQESDSREERGVVLKIGSGITVDHDADGIMRLAAEGQAEQPGCMVYRSGGSNLSVLSASSWMDPVFNGEAFDRGACWDNVTDDRLEVPTGAGGLWFIWWQTSWQVAAGTNWIIMRLMKNTSTVLNAPYFDQGSTAQWHSFNTAWLGILADGDTVEPQVRSANNVTMHGANDRTYLVAMKLL